MKFCSSWGCGNKALRNATRCYACLTGKSERKRYRLRGEGGVIYLTAGTPSLGGDIIIRGGDGMTSSKGSGGDITITGGIGNAEKQK